MTEQEINQLKPGDVIKIRLDTEYPWSRCLITAVEEVQVVCEDLSRPSVGEFRVLKGDLGDGWGRRIA